MSASFAVPAIVRLPHTVAARRALLVAFFLGGLLGLAFLVGGSAHAAEIDDSSDATATLDSSGELRQRADDRMDEQAEKSAERRQAVGDAEDATTGAAEETVELVAEQMKQVPQPVAGLAEDAAGASAKLPAGTSNGDQGSRARPRPPSDPADAASIPALPLFTTLPAAPSVPVTRAFRPPPVSRLCLVPPASAPDGGPRLIRRRPRTR